MERIYGGLSKRDRCGVRAGEGEYADDAGPGDGGYSGAKGACGSFRVESPDGRGRAVRRAPCGEVRRAVVGLGKVSSSSALQILPSRA